jgi:subtilisin family serine protease
MKTLALIALSAIALGACAPPRTVAAPPTAPPPAARPVAPTTPSPVVIREAPRNWQLLDESADHVPGISAERAYRELLAGREPKRFVVVAVIDGGVDTSHVDLRANLWTNTKEIPGNGKDDDGNGYVDDVRGWNFIGGRDGKDVRYDTFELTRQYARCIGRSTAEAPLSPDSSQCKQLATDYQKERMQTEQTLQQIKTASEVLAQVTQILRQAVGTDSLTVDAVSALQPSRPEVQRARQVYLQLAADGLTPVAITDARTAYQSRLQYGLDPSYDPRAIVGDHYTDVTERRYGNPDVTGPDAKHGTHVAGIIGAVRGNGIGIDGIAPAVRIMSVRTVPDGDERDKDVANAIRYAVDNGASVVNMSFGKAYSPFKAAVDDAVKYADAHGVLLIHAAGNDGADLSQGRNFPTPVYQDGGRPRNWIEVGASSWKGGDSLAAPFSNYGHDLVDVFAPGVDILSTVPGGGYERDSGTSMAAPVVTGLAALLMAYYPDLTAADVKRIILASATRHANQSVVRPGGKNGEMVPFGSLSATGGIVNAYAAVRMAEEAAAQKH